MGVVATRTRSSGLSGFAPILLANGVPLVGVLAFGWTPETLIAIYVIEIVLSILFAAFKTLFAARRPPSDRDGMVSVSASNLVEKRGHRRLVEWLPPIYPRNVPFAVSVFGVLLWISIFLGVAIAQLFDPASFAWPEVLLAASGLVIAQGLDVARDYFGNERYREVSPYSVIETPTRQAFFLAFALFVLTGEIGVALGFDSTVVLGLIVLIKVVIDWSAYRATHGTENGGFTGWLAGPTETPAESDPVDVPPGEPRVRTPTHRKSVLAASLFRLVFPTIPVYAVWFVFVWTAVVGVGLGSEPSLIAVLAGTGLVAGLFVLTIAISVASYYLRYGPLEYHRYDDRIVVYDTLLEEPQWAVSTNALREADPITTRFADRLFDTRTFEVTTGWGDDRTERNVGPVADADAFVEAFGVPVRTTDLEPMNRSLAWAGAVSAVGIAVFLLALVFGPEEPLLPAFTAIFLFPFVGLVSFSIWRLAYRD